MTATLIILAAGLGSRYGGAKQFEPVGAGGATLMDYALFDARRAGFDRAVVVIRPDMDPDVGAWAAERRSGAMDIAIAHQRPDDGPGGPGRTKPWGTAHALLAAAPLTGGPCAVVNADDFYGRSAYEAAADFLSGAAAGEWALVGYRLRDTLSRHGGVNRGVCRMRGEHVVVAIEEVTGIAEDGDGTLAGSTPAGPVSLDGDAPVSMNFWAFMPDIFPVLERGFARFRAGADPGAEYLLPAAVQEAVRGGLARVRLLAAGARWFGMTHPADRPAVADALRALHASGDYPERLGP